MKKLSGNNGKTGYDILFVSIGERVTRDPTGTATAGGATTCTRVALSL
jgi:hypothetical protein